MNTRRAPRMRALLLLALVSVWGCAGSGSNDSVPPNPNEIRIGGLLSITGNWNTLGKASQAAMELARDDVNAYFAAHGSNRFVKITISDTKLDPALALTQMNAMSAQGTKVFIGPQSSSEVANVKAAADANNNLVISQGSTASSLSIAGDNVFRLVPDDVREARALVALLQADTIQAIVPVAREDAGNTGLYNSTRARFADVGGSVSTGVRYAPTVTDFTATVADIRAQVDTLLATHTAAQIGIYLAAFDEAAEILALAKADPVLSTVKWYGSDGVVQSTAITANNDGASFAVTSGYPNPIFGLDDATAGTWQPVADRIKARSGVDADAFALSAYDAVWLAALAHESAGGIGDFVVYRNAFITKANSYTGTTGSTALDAEGDRDFGNFDFWGVTGTAGAFTWKRVAIYKASDGSIVRTP